MLFINSLHMSPSFASRASRCNPCPCQAQPGFGSVPQECETLLGRGTKRDRSGPVVVKVSHKLCRRCNVDKEAGQFFQSKLSLDGLCTYCKVGGVGAWGSWVQPSCRSSTQV